MPLKVIPGGPAFPLTETPSIEKAKAARDAALRDFKRRQLALILHGSPEDSEKHAGETVHRPESVGVGLPFGQLSSTPPPPMQATVTKASIENVVGHLKTLDESRQSFIRGERVGAKELGLAAMSRAQILKGRPEIGAMVWGANTIPSELQRQVILQDAMGAFAILLLPLMAFSTRFNQVPLEGTNKIEVPFYDLDTTDAVDFDQSVGYTFGDSTTSFREIQVNKRKYKGLAFNSAEMRRQPYLNAVELAKLSLNRLAVLVMNDVCSPITNANYGAPVLNEVASGFDSDSVIGIKTACNKSQWPTVGRSLILDSDYDDNLQRDNAVKLAMAYGGSEVIRDGQIPVISGFKYYQSPNLPDNGEGLKGLVCLPPALLIATSPIMPGAGVRKVLVNYDIVVHPDLGIAFEYRYWGQAQPDSDYEVCECNYGYQYGNASALKRITTPV